MDTNVLETDNEYKDIVKSLHFDIDRVPYIFREAMTDDEKIEINNIITEFFFKKVAKEIDDNTDFIYCVEVKRLFHKKKTYYFENEEEVVNYLLENAWNKNKARYTKVNVWVAIRYFKKIIRKCKKFEIKSFKEFMNRKEKTHE